MPYLVLFTCFYLFVTGGKELFLPYRPVVPQIYNSLHRPVPPTRTYANEREQKGIKAKQCERKQSRYVAASFGCEDLWMLWT